ncbi:class I adenylate-forming enzyme family protein [Patulibacter americanus]|uniref:class I adenylate-forming enzyme family protein n=1 Tax=Patulibacter americanus TaxID=588672 RepID=UPI0003B66AF6|nr:AMP-binding protein [Patulibacter americanus]
MRSVESWLLRSARRRPDHEAFVGTTYRALAAEVDDAARRLWSAGARPGRRAGLALPPGRPFVVALHGLLRLGAVVVPLDPRLPAAERERRLQGATLAVDAGTDLGALAPAADAELLDRHDLDAAAIVVHTSGTSGPAKAIPLTYGNWLWSALGSAATLGCPPGERWLCALPLNHVGGLSVLLRSAIAGTTAVVHEGWDTDRVLAELRGELGRPAPTVVSLVPTTLRRLLDAGLRGPGTGTGEAPALRWVLLGGAAIPGGMLEEAAVAGIPVAPTYGMSEAASQIATLGPPLFCTHVEIAGADGRPTRTPGVTGEVLVSGPTVCREVVGEDGRLRTGDLGVLDERGHLAIVGRSSDTIITGGENVLPLEVERVLEAQPGVVEAAVFGRPDPEWGERVCARIVPAPGARIDPEELRRHAALHLLRHQLPREIEVVDVLPRTPSGKLLRRELA